MISIAQGYQKIMLFISQGSIYVLLSIKSILIRKDLLDLNFQFNLAQRLIAMSLLSRHPAAGEHLRDTG